MDRAAGISSDLIANIYISKTGKITFVNVLGKNKGIKDQLKKVLTLMPDWQPGKLNGEPIDTLFAQPILFSIENPRARDSTVYEFLNYSVSMTSTDMADMRKEAEQRATKQKEGQTICKQAKAELDKNNYSSAIALYKKAQAGGYTPNGAFYYNLGVAYIKAGVKDSACMSFKEAALLDDAEAYNFYLKNCK